MIGIQININDLIANEKYKELFENIDDEEEFVISAVDSPIIKNGKVIGVINDVDLDEGIMYGAVWGDAAISIDIQRKRISSIHLIKEEYGKYTESI